MGNPVVHFEVVGKDASALQRFYANAFGWEMRPAIPGYAMAHPNTESGINGGVGAAPDGGTGHVTFYIEVDDLKAALSTIERLGGTRVAGPMDVPGGPSIALFSDPEGHVVGLVGTGSRRADGTLAVVRAYHRGWTSKNFEEAVRLLAPDLQVAVPINDYPTKESFAQALMTFGGLVRSVDLLAEFAKGNEAMLLYDMDVAQLGKLRIAEHFTVADGRIARIRQIHDTAALRAAGFGRSPVTP